MGRIGENPFDSDKMNVVDYSTKMLVIGKVEEDYDRKSSGADHSFGLTAKKVNISPENLESTQRRIIQKKRSITSQRQEEFSSVARFL